jgi:hypothetical protein
MGSLMSRTRLTTRAVRLIMPSQPRSGEVIMFERGLRPRRTRDPVLEPPHHGPRRRSGRTRRGRGQSRRPQSGGGEQRPIAARGRWGRISRLRGCGHGDRREHGPLRGQGSVDELRPPPACCQPRETAGQPREPDRQLRCHRLQSSLDRSTRRTMSCCTFCARGWRSVVRDEAARPGAKRGHAPPGRAHRGP